MDGADLGGRDGAEPTTRIGAVHPLVPGVLASDDGNVTQKEPAATVASDSELLAGSQLAPTISPAVSDSPVSRVRLGGE